MVTINVDYKRRVETCLKEALKNALTERVRIGERLFMEETLRYAVMQELTHTRYVDFPRFPSRKGAGPVLLFQIPYDRTFETDKRKVNALKKKFDNDSFVPDITCVRITPKGKVTDHYYVIELKVVSNEKDIQKCKEYVDGHAGEAAYDFAVVIDVNSAWRWNLSHFNKAITTIGKGNILWVTTDGMDKIMSKWFVFE
jgi:hypothetical protein